MTEESPPEAGRVRRAWTAVRAAGRRAYRYGRRFAVTIGVIVAVIVVSLLTLDLGPAARGWAEREGGKWLDRKLGKDPAGGGEKQRAPLQSIDSTHEDLAAIAAAVHLFTKPVTNGAAAPAASRWRDAGRMEALR